MSGDWFEIGHVTCLPVVEIRKKTKQKWVNKNVTMRLECVT